MVSTCTQFKYWTFPNDTELNRLREEANRKFIASRTSDEESEHVISENFLNAAEEFKLYFHYSKLLDDFCRDFQPPMPGYVLGTAMSYFKRFYLHNSVMDYHPRYVTYTCVYLACKVEEFNVSVQQFVGNIANTKHERYLLGGEAANSDFDRFEELTSIVINFEMLLMHQLRYHLTVHNPYRPLEGLLIDIKANCGIGDDNLRPVASKLLQKMLFTDAILVFTPSQLALAAVMYAARKANVDIRNYVSEKLFAPNNNGGNVPNYEELTERIFKLISEAEKKPSRDEVQRIEHKLMRCQNVENDPRSVEYKRRMLDELQEDDQEPVVKKFRTSDDDD